MLTKRQEGFSSADTEPIADAKSNVMTACNLMSK
jgi:hypothetical protein